MRRDIGRVIAYVACIVAVAWLAMGHVQFRQALRDLLQPAYGQLSRDEVNGNAGKVLNSYYESIYEALPNTVLPGAILMIGSTVLFFTRHLERADKTGRT